MGATAYDRSGEALILRAQDVHAPACRKGAGGTSEKAKPAWRRARDHAQRHGHRKREVVHAQAHLECRADLSGCTNSSRGVPPISTATHGAAYGVAEQKAPQFSKR